jgi:hypothetical protein
VVSNDAVVDAPALAVNADEEPVVRSDDEGEA